MEQHVKDMTFGRINDARAKQIPGKKTTCLKKKDYVQRSY
jgi:hypothetical protein